MKNINLEPNNYYFLKILLYLMISIFVFLCNSKIIFSNNLNMNINNLNTPEEELAIKYCDAINKKIFKGLKEDYYDLWTDLLQKYVKQNEVTGEIYSGDLINLNSKKELNLLDGLVVE